MEKPTFNLKAVVQETGLKPDTLRAWERRYGLPQPRRTSGGHRLYSQKDIEILKWLTARQEEGLSISRAVALWRKLKNDGLDPFEETNDAVPQTADPPPTLQVGDTIAKLRGAWVDACLAFDEQKAENILSQAFALYPQETVCFEVLQKGLASIGEGWYEGKTTVQQEHFASSLAMRRLDSLIASTPPPTRNKRILIGCPPEEDHVFIPILLALLLRRRGWNVIYLGANVPSMRLEATVSSTESDLVIMSAQQLHTAANLAEIGRFLRERNVPMAFGGAIFNFIPAMVERIPGFFLGKTLQQAVPTVEDVLQAGIVAPKVHGITKKYEHTLHHYRDNQARLEAHVWHNLGESDIAQAHLSIANMRLARSIIAALLLGNIAFLGHDLSWVEGLLENYHLPTLHLREYIEAYHRAADVVLGDDGAIIVNWLEDVLDTAS